MPCCMRSYLLQSCQEAEGTSQEISYADSRALLWVKVGQSLSGSKKMILCFAPSHWGFAACSCSLGG